MIAFIKKNHQLVLILIVLLLGLALRLWRLATESAWIDEAYSIQLARFSLPLIVQGTAADQHPPLYYFLLHFWLLLNDTIWNARFLSVLLGVFNIWQVIHLGIKLRNFKVGIISGLLVAVMPLHVYYSQEVRMYMLHLVTLTGSIDSLLNWLKEKKKSQLILYTLLCSSSLYTHNFFVFILLVQAVFVVVWSVWHRERRTFLLWFSTMVICLISYLPWLPVVINQLSYHTMNWLQIPTAATFRDTFLRLVLGFPLPTLPKFLTWSITGVILVILTGVLFHLRKRKDVSHLLILIFLWTFLPFIAISGISLKYPIFQIKQFIIILPAIAIFIAIISELLPKWFGRVLIIGMVMAYFGASIGQGIKITKDDWRGTAAYLQGNFIEGDIIFGNPSASSLAVNLYAPDLPVESYAGYPPNYNIIKGGWAEGNIITAINAKNVLQPYLDHHRIWLVEFSPQLWDPEALLPKELAQNYDQILDLSFTRIRLRLFTKK